MTIYEHLTHIPRLSHVDKRPVNRAVTMRMIFSHRIADDTRALLIRLIRTVVHLIHRVQNSSLYRLQSISYIRKCTGNDDRHRIIQKVSADFLGQFCFSNMPRVKL